MTTSLAAQLQKLAVPQTSLLLRDKKRASLLFDPKEAANHDRDTFYDIGISGLKELQKFNTEFASYENTLFSSTSKNFERAVEDKETNQKLDKTIRKFLLLLSPYFLLKPAHKALEWLINRFSIHEYNKEDVLKLILPYHETNIFVRFLQILNVRDPNDSWHWLHPLQKPGVHLPKQTLFNHAASEVGFLKFLGQTVLQAIKENGASAKSLTTLFTFYCTTTIGAFEHSQEIIEPQINVILIPLLKGLNSDVVDFTASAFMITAQLLKKCNVSQKVLDQLVLKITSDRQRSLRTEATLLLLLIYQSQRETYRTFPKQGLHNLVQSDWFVINLNKLLSSGSDILPLVVPLIKGLMVMTEDENNKKFIENFITEVHFNDDKAELFIRTILDCCPPSKTQGKWTGDYLKCLENQYPNAFDKVVREVLSNKEAHKHRQALSSVMKFMMSDCYNQGNVDIFVKLYNPNPQFRASAVNFLRSNIFKLQAKEIDMLKGAVGERLIDDDKEVVKSVLKLDKKHLLKFLGKETLTELLIKLLRKCRIKKWSSDVSINVIDLLCNGEIGGNGVSVFLAILPVILPTTHDELMVALYVLKTEYSNKCKILMHIKNKVPRKLTPEEFVQNVYTAIAEEDCLPELEVLVDALDNINDNKDVTQQYMSAVLISHAFSKCSRVKTTLKALRQFRSYTDTLKKKIVKDKPIQSPVVNYCIDVLKEDKVPVQGLLSCLSNIIYCTQKIDNVRNAWLNFVEPDNAVEFLIEVYVVLLDGSSSDNLHSSILKEFFDKFFPTVRDKIEFLSNFIIITTSNFKNVHSLNYITVQTQIRTLKVLQSIFENYNKDSLNWMFNFNSKIVIPALLISLANPLRAIRILSLEILNTVVNKYKTKNMNNYVPLLKELLIHREEILLDNEQLALILFTVFSPEKSNIKMPAINSLVHVASETNFPVHVTSSLLSVLTFVNSSEIFTTTSKLAINVLKSINNNNETVVDVYRSKIFYNVVLRLNETTAASIKLNSPTWEMLYLGLKHDITTLEYAKGKYSCPSVLVLDQINKEVFNNFEYDVKYALIRLLSELTVEIENPEVVTAIGHVIKKIDLDAKLIIDGFIEMRDAKSKKVIVDDTQGRRRSKRASLIPTTDILDTKEWKRGVTLLEFIQDKKKLKNTDLLLPMLFEVLKKCLDFDEQAAVEYPKQLLLSSILHCCSKIKEEKISIIESSFNMELVVQCVRASQNPQTHHHALLVLAHTAAIIPEQVLHNIMAIFTFMGSSVLRHDDSYSFQIISKIIDTVIPILVNANKQQNENNVAGVLRVFVDVILDVPEHRRMPLFTKLLSTLGINEYLNLFLLLVFESHVIHGNEKQKQPVKGRLLINNENIPRRLNIATNMVLQYPPEIILSTAIKLVNYLKNLPAEKNNDENNAMDVDEIITTFNVKKYTPKQFRHYKYTIVTFLSGLLSLQDIVNRLAVMNEKEILKLESLFKDMIIHVLTYIQTISKISDKSSGTPQAQYWKVMLHHSYDILDSINALLTSDMFLLVVRGLIVHNIPTVRRKAMELLNTKLQNHPSYFYTDPADVEINKPEQLFALLPSLMAIVKTIDSHNVQQESEQELNQQTSLLTLKLLVKLLAEKYPEKFVPLLDFMTDLIKSEKAQGNILASVVLCLAELCYNLRARAIPALVKYMPAIIKVLKQQKRQESPNLLLMCIITALHRIVESLPLFLSPYLEKILCELSILSSKWVEDANNQKIAPFIAKLLSIRKRIGSTIPPRVLIPCIGRSYNTLIRTNNYNAIGSLMNVLSENLSSVQGQELTLLLPDLTQFFLTALQFRTDNELDPKDINLVEDNIINALTVLVLKLSETTFRPLYYKLYDWAVRNETRNERVITFYRLSFGIAASLKSLFVLFAGHFVTNAAEILDKCNQLKSDNDLYFVNSEDKCILLVENVLKTLQTVFLYDSQSFLDKDKFETLMQPLVDQLENRLGGLESLQKRAEEFVIPCIAQFAVSTADDSLWKQLNYQILLKTRHDLPAVRLIALNCTCAVACKIGEDFLPLLPETIPFLAELLEDEDEKVETACQKAVQDLEKTLGESLQKYF